MDDGRTLVVVGLKSSKCACLLRKAVAVRPRSAPRRSGLIHTTTNGNKTHDMSLLLLLREPEP